MRDACISVDIAGQQVVFHAKLLLRRAVNAFRSPQAPRLEQDWKRRSLRALPWSKDWSEPTALTPSADLQR
jgi:hypothetical protein